MKTITARAVTARLSCPARLATSSSADTPTAGVLLLAATDGTNSIHVGAVAGRTVRAAEVAANANSAVAVTAHTGDDACHAESSKTDWPTAGLRRLVEEVAASSAADAPLAMVLFVAHAVAVRPNVAVAVTNVMLPRIAVADSASTELEAAGTRLAAAVVVVKASTDRPVTLFVRRAVACTAKASTERAVGVARLLPLLVAVRATEALADAVVRLRADAEAVAARTLVDAAGTLLAAVDVPAKASGVTAWMRRIVAAEAADTSNIGDRAAVAALFWAVLVAEMAAGAVPDAVTFLRAVACPERSTADAVTEIAFLRAVQVAAATRVEVAVLGSRLAVTLVAANAIDDLAVTAATLTVVACAVNASGVKPVTAEDWAAGAVGTKRLRGSRTEMVGSGVNSGTATLVYSSRTQTVPEKVASSASAVSSRTHRVVSAWDAFTRMISG